MADHPMDNEHHDRKRGTNAGLNPWSAWNCFWFAATDSTSLHCLRVLAGGLVVFWLLSNLGHANDLYSTSGWFDATAYREYSRLTLDERPAPIGWSLLFMANSPFLAGAFYVFALFAALAFTLGYATRCTGIITWVVVVSYTVSPVISFGGDVLLRVLIFYVAVGYLLYGWTSGETLLGRLFGARELELTRGAGALTDTGASVASNITMRCLQVHLVLVFWGSVAHKLQHSAWWAGDALWFAFHPAGTQPTMAFGREGSAWIFTLGTYLILAWQICFPFVVNRGTVWRALMLGGAFVGWMGCYFVYAEPLTGPVLFFMALAHLPPQGWHQAVAWLEQLPGIQRLLSRRLDPSSAAHAVSNMAA